MIIVSDHQADTGYDRREIGLPFECRQAEGRKEPQHPDEQQQLRGMSTKRSLGPEQEQRRRKHRAPGEKVGPHHPQIPIERVPVGGRACFADESGIPSRFDGFADSKMVLIPGPQHLRVCPHHRDSHRQAGPEVSIFQHPRIALNGGIQRHHEQRQKKPVHLFQHRTESHADEGEQIPA